MAYEILNQPKKIEESSFKSIKPTLSMKYEIKKKPTKKEEPKTSFKSIKPSKSIKNLLKK